MSVSDSTMRSDCSTMAAIASLQEDEMDIGSNQQEYETQYFGFTPKSFVNGVYNAVVQYLRDGFDVMEQYISQEYSGVMTESQIKEATNNMLPHLVKKLDRAFDNLENYLSENVFHIPENVVLPEDEVHLAAPYTKEDELAINKETEDLRNKIVALKYANAKIQQELSDIEIVQAKFDQVLGQLQKLQVVSEEAGVSDPKDMLVYTIDHTKKLMDIVKSIDSSS